MLLFTELYLMQSGICYGNNTVFNEDNVDDGPDSGITCFRRGSTSMAIRVNGQISVTPINRTLVLHHKTTFRNSATINR